MNLEPKLIYKEYLSGVDFKEALGTKGLYEQSKINERFYVGDQWYGANCGNDRPLVRYNVIKRIGDYKISQIISSPVSVKFSAGGFAAANKKSKESMERIKLLKGGEGFKGQVNADELDLLMPVLEDYRNTVSHRVALDSLLVSALKKAFISGTGIIYTYWDKEVNSQYFGDINCEVLDIGNVYFADPYCTNIQNQPYIIIASERDAESLKNELGEKNSRGLKADKNGRVLVLTKFYKSIGANGKSTVRCVKVTENTIIREDFDTLLTRYPLAAISWDEKEGVVYGESEITYLIPNQIAINRMITANVWSAMTMGMPMMVVNGDTVNADITNDPGQIIKVYGTNEDVSGAVKYVTPPDFCSNLSGSVNELITNTLTQSGANEVALGDSRADNAAALATMLNAATLPLQLLKDKYYRFLGELSLIWVDFWFTHYGNRSLKIEDESGIWYMPFDAGRYADIVCSAKVKAEEIGGEEISETVNTLTMLYEKGILNKQQLIKRLPSGILSDKEEILEELGKEEKYDGSQDI